MHPRSKKTFLIACLVLFAAAACSRQSTFPIDATAPASTGVVNTTPLQTSTASPATPDSAVSPLPRQARVILAAPAGTDALLLESIQMTISRLAAAENLEFEVKTSLTAADLTPDVRIAVVTQPPGWEENAIDLNGLAAAAPAIQFLGIDAPGEVSENVSLIRTAGPDQLGFLGGYLAAVVTPEWRVGALTASGDPAGVAAGQGFLNGVVFFCGLCQQKYPPFYTYPIEIELPSTASPAERQAAAATLIDQVVLTVYIGPGVRDEDILAVLAEAGLRLIGSQSPPAGLKDQWIATISSDVPDAIQAAWLELLAGKGGTERNARLVLKDINPDLLSPGRQLQVEKLIPDLQNGLIDTRVTPASDSP